MASKRRQLAFTENMALTVRRTIYEKFNAEDLRFNNDQVLEEIIKSGRIGKDSDTGVLESCFEQMCAVGLLRNIAQNLTTVWYKSFEQLTEVECTACGLQVHVGKRSDVKCPNPACSAPL